MPSHYAYSIFISVERKRKNKKMKIVLAKYSVHKKVRLKLRYIGNDLNPFLFAHFLCKNIFHFPSCIM